MSSPQIFILSGTREIGKTTLLIKLVERARLMHILAAGVISPPVYSEGKKVGIDLMDVKTGVKKKLADLRRNDSSGMFTDHWSFLDESLNWGNELLGQCTPCDLLIVDELGPIELERGQGWQNGLTAIASNDYQVAVLIIRPELISTSKIIWPQAQVLQIDEKSDQTAKIIIERILACFSE